MRVLVTGGRNYGDYEHVTETLDKLNVTELATGGAGGADTLAELWAYEREIPCHVYTAEWSVYGRPAGPIRNQQMLNAFQPDLVVAFPGGKGTTDMVSRAMRVNVKVLEA